MGQEAVSMQDQENELDLTPLMLCGCGNLRMAARAVTQLFDEILQPTGLRVTQFALIAAITHFGPTTISHLAEIFSMDRTTLTRNLRPLERDGLINIRAGEDRRTRELTVTERGREAVVSAFPLWEKAQARIVNGLGQERFSSLLSHLSEVVSLTR